MGGGILGEGIWEDARAQGQALTSSIFNCIIINILMFIDNLLDSMGLVIVALSNSLGLVNK